MQYLLLWLEGALQSWGDSSRFDSRQTLNFPTKSGIYGLLLASSGDSGAQKEILARLSRMQLTIFIFDKVHLQLSDYHTVGCRYDSSDDWQKMHTLRNADGKTPNGNTRVTYRNYLVDQAFAALLELPDDLATKFAASLQTPVYDLYLGRKCCAPQEFIFQGVFNTQEDAENKIREIAQRKKRSIVRRIREAAGPFDGDAILLNDVPVRFGEHHLYRDRWVVSEEYS